MSTDNYHSYIWRINITISSDIWAVSDGSVDHRSLNCIGSVGYRHTLPTTFKHQCQFDGCSPQSSSPVLSVCVLAKRQLDLHRWRLGDCWPSWDVMVCHISEFSFKLNITYNHCLIAMIVMGWPNDPLEKSRSLEWSTTIRIWDIKSNTVFSLISTLGR